MKTAPLIPAAPPLAGLLADMRAESAQLAAQAGVVAVLRAMILDCLIRLFGRLDHLLVLWQSGQLAPPSPRQTEAPRQDPTPEPRVQPDPHHPRAARPRATRNRAPMPCSTAPHHATPQFPATGPNWPTPAIPPAAPISPYPPRIRPPPWPGVQNRPFTPSPKHAHIVTL